VNPARRVNLADAPFAGRTGMGVRVAVIDSGVALAHPHVGGVAGGAAITRDGVGPDIADRVGHGTAVLAAIHEKAPGADLLAVRVFDRTLATTADVLARAIEWSAAQGARLINVSLGTPNAAHGERLADAVRAAAAARALVVAARDARAPVLLPGSLAGVVGVHVDSHGARDSMVVETGPHGLVLHASGWPRPIEGLPPERNVSGVSFAVANATGFLARALEVCSDVVDLPRLAELLTE
jgi:hypothetical protein